MIIDRGAGGSVQSSDQRICLTAYDLLFCALPIGVFLSLMSLV